MKSLPFAIGSLVLGSALVVALGRGEPRHRGGATSTPPRTVARLSGAETADPGTVRRCLAWPASLPGSDGGAEAQAGRPAARLIDADPALLRHLVRTAVDSEEAHEAIWAMGNRLRLSDEDVDALLARLSLAATDPPHVVRVAVWALSLRPDRLPVDEVSRIALRHPAAEVRRTAVRALIAVPGDIGTRTMRSVALGDVDAVNRREAITFLALRLDPSQAIDLVRVGLAAETDPETRARYINLAGLQDSPEARAIVSADDSSRVVR